MKFFLFACVVCIFAATYAEPPSFHQNFQRNQAFTSGLRAPNPNPRFRGFARQQEQPKPVYGPPASNQPSEGYLSPANAAAEQVTGLVLEPEAEQIEVSERLRSAEAQSYYIYHPNGVLEKITYSPNSNLQTVAVTSPIRTDNSKIIREPIYTYDPSSFLVQRLQ